MNLTKREYKERISLGDNNNAVIRLIAVQLVVFVFLIFMRTYFYLSSKDEAVVLSNFSNKILNYFILSGDWSELASKPWTLLTNFISHISTWAIFANMVWLWAFGTIMQDLTGNNKIIPVFIYGSLAANIAFLLTINLSPSYADAASSFSYFGAHAGVMAVAIATTTTYPNYKLFPMIKGGIPMWILTAIYVLITFGTAPAFALEYTLPLAVAMLMGFLFIFFIKRGFDMGQWMNRLYDWFNNLFDPKKQKANYHIKDHLFYNATTAPFTKTMHVTQKRIDDILEKIHAQGFESLTQEEKDLLQRVKDEDL